MKMRESGQMSEGNTADKGACFYCLCFVLLFLIRYASIRAQYAVMDRGTCVALEGNIKERCRISFITNVNAIIGKSSFLFFIINVFLF